MAGAWGYLDKLIGRRLILPGEVIERYPELGAARFRLGGIPLNIGGWALGMSHVAGFTLGRTIFLHREPHAGLDDELLLHELRHVHQFLESKSFPVKYLWQSIRRGYLNNAYEVDARRFAEKRLRTGDTDGKGGRA